MAMTGMWRQELKRPTSIPALPRPPLLLLIALRRWRLLFVGDPGDEEAEPVVCGLHDLHADARRAVDGRRDAHDARRGLDGRAVGTVRAQVELVAAPDLLVEVEERAQSRDVVGLGRLAPSRTILRATRHDNRQTQRHAQRESSLF